MAMKQILIVDDELDMRIFLSTLLETSGYRPVTCQNGLDGVSKARSIKPDLILLDVMMPGDGGVKMYRALKTDPELWSIPVIMITAVGRNSFTHYLKMLNTGLPHPVSPPVNYLEKPVDTHALLAALERVFSAPCPTDGNGS
jgi:two-component system, OmpR family, phosphate regulon response regulator PhoB